MRPFRGLGIVLAVVLGLGVIFTFVLGRSYGELALKAPPFNRLGYVPSFDPEEDVTLGLVPNADNVSAPKPQNNIRVIEVYPTQTLLIAGGKAVTIIDHKAPATLASLVKLIDKPGWISEEDNDLIVMKAAVILQRGSVMNISAPITTGVLMETRPGVFLGDWAKSKLTINGVQIVAGNNKVPDAYEVPAETAGRPFILADQGATMNITHSDIEYLGRDWNSSYGVTWAKGSTGSITYSTLDHDFIGLYTNDAHNVVMSHDVTDYNSLYGIDPHSGSTNLTVTYNTSEYNGRHGIIFSNHVEHSVVAHNITRFNHLNGIMMDETSINNVISDNDSDHNQADGMVFQNSPNNTATGNLIENNRVGVTVRGSNSKILLSKNTVSGNLAPAQGISLSGNTQSNNGGDWEPGRIGLIWGADGLLFLVFLVCTLVSNLRRNRIAVTA